MKKKEALAIIHWHYPNAVSTNDAMEQLIDFVEETLDLKPEKIMLADSICSDDVNSIQYPTKASKFLGPFKMGGLDGFPFTGLTGMGAFASHVPDEGALCIYYGPHIGISENGTIGEIHRFGQAKNSGSCGAAKKALANLADDKIVENEIDDIDYQMNTIEQILLKQKDRILSANIPLQEATEVIYEAIDERIHKLIEKLIEKTSFPCKYIILMGVIHINGDRKMGSFASVRRFDLINTENKEQRTVQENHPV